MLEIKRLFVFILSFLFALTLQAQTFAVKTNALYWLTTTPNIGVACKLSKFITLGANLNYNPFNLTTLVLKKEGYLKKEGLKHWTITPELKYWFCKAYQQSFIGIQGVYGAYNIGGIKPFNIINDHHYKGNVYGGGIIGGHHFILSEHWGIELSTGIGYLKMNYQQNDWKSAYPFRVRNFSRYYLGITHLEVSFTYLIH